jgi:hypothetical protein
MVVVDELVSLTPVRSPPSGIRVVVVVGPASTGGAMAEAADPVGSGVWAFGSLPQATKTRIGAARPRRTMERMPARYSQAPSPAKTPSTNRVSRGSIHG